MAYPGTIQGTWTGQANQSQIAITIYQTSGTFGPCKPIAGYIGTDQIEGFYCPATGRFNFVRFNPTSGPPSQDYSGHVSTGSSNTAFMGGTFGQVSGTPQVRGEYNFSASCSPGADC
jgi:hypothetical protein